MSAPLLTPEPRVVEPLEARAPEGVGIVQINVACGPVRAGAHRVVPITPGDRETALAALADALEVASEGLLDSLREELER